MALRFNSLFLLQQRRQRPLRTDMPGLYAGQLLVRFHRRGDGHEAEKAASVIGPVLVLGVVIHRSSGVTERLNDVRQSSVFTDVTCVTELCLLSSGRVHLSRKVSTGLFPGWGYGAVASRRLALPVGTKRPSRAHRWSRGSRIPACCL